MLLSITLEGETFARDTANLPAVSVDYLISNGYSQRLRDSFASVTEKKFPDPTERRVKRIERVNEVLAQLDNGTPPGSRAPADPNAALVRAVLAKIKESGDTDLATVSADQVVAAIAKMAKKKVA